LRAAIAAKCDAVYFGVQGMNMRATARNFLQEELSDVVAFCHNASVKAYLTLNTIVYEHEREQMQALVSAAAVAGVDAIIAWDFSVIEEARKHGLVVHASTQMSVANAGSLLLLHRELGIERFILARECSLDDIRAIRGTLDRELGSAAETVEIEVFVHGNIKSVALRKIRILCWRTVGS